MTPTGAGAFAKPSRPFISATGVRFVTRNRCLLRPPLSILLTVQLTPREQEKLLIYVAADLARRRRQRGLKLNLPESTALITEAMLEGARDGRRASEVMELGRHVLTRDEVMAEVPELLHVVQVEATFPDGTKLVSCHDPIP